MDICVGGLLNFRGPASSQLYISGGVHREKNCESIRNHS